MGSKVPPKIASFKECTGCSGAACQAARRLATGAPGGLPTRRRIPSCPTSKHHLPSVTGLRPLDRHRIDFDFLDGTILGATGNLGDLLHHVVTLDHFAEDAVLVVQPRGGRDGNEELAAVGVGTGVGHGEEAVLGVDRKSTRLNSSHLGISYAVFCLK